MWTTDDLDMNSAEKLVEDINLRQAKENAAGKSTLTNIEMTAELAVVRADNGDGDRRKRIGSTQK